MSKEQINWSIKETPSEESQKERYLTLAQEKLNLIKNLVAQSRYDLPEKRLLGSDSHSELYMCRGTVIMGFEALVSTFSMYMIRAGFDQKDKLDDLQKLTRVLIAISIRRGTERKTPEDMNQIKQYVEKISKQVQLIYDLQQTHSTVQAAH